MRKGRHAIEFQSAITRASLADTMAKEVKRNAQVKGGKEKAAKEAK